MVFASRKSKGFIFFSFGEHFKNLKAARILNCQYISSQTNNFSDVTSCRNIISIEEEVHH